MTLTRFFLLLSVAVLMATGQILFKLGARDLEGETLASLLRTTLTSVPILVGIVLYGVTTILWVLVLKDTDLSRAYPFVALTLVLVPLAGIIVFGETISPWLLTGGALIVAGVIVISVGA